MQDQKQNFSFSKYAWNQFKKNKPAKYSLYLLFILIIVAILAPYLANERPLYAKYKGNTIYPAFASETQKDSIFRADGSLENILQYDITDWRTLEYESVIWAPITYDNTFQDKYNRKDIKEEKENEKDLDPTKIKRTSLNNKIGVNDLREFIQDVSLSPSARKFINESKNEINNLNTIATNGRVTKESFSNLKLDSGLNAFSANENTLSNSTDVSKPLSKMRQSIAHRLKEAQNTAAMLTTFNEIDMGNVISLRAKYKDYYHSIAYISELVILFWIGIQLVMVYLVDPQTLVLGSITSASHLPNRLF